MSDLKVKTNPVNGLLCGNPVEKAADSGIYRIINRINGKVYIGSSKNRSDRWNSHKMHLRRGTHHSGHLQKAWTKYGAGNFFFQRLDDCPVEELVEIEQAFLDTVKPEYNVNPSAASSRGAKRSPEECLRCSLRQIGRKQRPETVAKRIAKLYGQKRSVEQIARIVLSKGPITNETRRKIAISKLGNKNALGAIRSADTRAKMSLAQARRTTPSGETRRKMSESAKRRANKLARDTETGRWIRT